MSDKEKLIELMQEWGNANTDSFPFESVADYLIKKGVIVPPCKVGNTVYVICNKMVQETTVFSMKTETEDKKYVFYIKALAIDGMNKTVHGDVAVFRIFVFGKTVFLTREEAKKALAEREVNE